MSLERSRKIKKVHAKVSKPKPPRTNNKDYSVIIDGFDTLTLVRNHLCLSDFEEGFGEYTYTELFELETISGKLEIIVYDEILENFLLVRKDWIDVEGTSDDFKVTVQLPIKPLPFEYCQTAYVANVNLSLSGEDALVDLYNSVDEKEKEENSGQQRERKTNREEKKKTQEKKRKKKEKQQIDKKKEESQSKEAPANNKEKEDLIRKLVSALSQIVASEAIQPEKKTEEAQAGKTEEPSTIDEPLQLLDQTESAEFLIFIQDENGIEDYYVIHKTPTLHKPREHMLFYSTLQARETMSAAFRPERDGRGKYANNEFSVTGIVYKTGDEVAYTTVAKEIVIRSGGGKNTSVVSNNFKVIDLLLFSPKTNRYEIIKATHDAANEVCFIDLAIYKVFVKHFGNPGLPYRFGDGSGEAIDNDGLNAESVLKSFGYSVAQNVGLSDKQRQDILADVVDLGMVSVSKVIWYLELFIRLHPGSRFYSAREKWERDEYFIANYSENPERFYIT